MTKKTAETKRTRGSLEWPKPDSCETQPDQDRSETPKQCKCEAFASGKAVHKIYDEIREAFEKDKKLLQEKVKDRLQQILDAPETTRTKMIRTWVNEL